ncbi:MAG TPA: hypothetical protein VFK36_09075 [Gemmatimonadales bacterium]|nr:hypothetical protein [Gemmatimonadales bacterium]
MRSYWIKIVAGAVLIFGIGMVIVVLARSVKHGVEYVSDSTGPISSPLFFLPFDLGGQRSGTFRHLTIYRDSAGKPSSVTLTVALRDSVSPAALSRCLVTLLPSGNGDYNPTSYQCLSATDTAGKALAPFGLLRIRSTDDSFPLFAPERDIAQLRSNWEPRMHRADSVQQFMNDSMRDAVQNQIESTMSAARERAESLRGTLPEQ